MGKCVDTIIINRICADEARRIADSVEATLKRIYKFICEEAKENARNLVFSLRNPSEKAKDAIIADLEEQGYKVTAEQEEGDEDYIQLHISWEEGSDQEEEQSSD